MDFIDKLHQISEQVSKTKDLLQTEEATKTALVMPFLNALGYNVFDPTEVVPEYTADLGTKKGEKVDYCIMQNGEPVILIECKHWKEKLDSHTSQLHRYYHTSSSRFGIITNGIQYQFYSDLEEPNKMDEKPFFEFSFDKITEGVASELKKFQKDNFNPETIIDTASELKYSKQIYDALSKEMKDPSEEFTKFFATKIYSGRITQKILEQFIPIMQKSTKQFLNEMISDRLKSALNTESEKPETVEENAPQVEAIVEEDNGIVTTEEELEGFRIVQAVLRRKIDLDRVHARDTKSYFGILFDDNNRKPICRLHFNSSNKYLGIFNSDKSEERILLSSLNDIYNYEERLLETACSYLEAIEA